MKYFKYLQIYTIVARLLIVLSLKTYLSGKRNKASVQCFLPKRAILDTSQRRNEEF